MNAFTSLAGYWTGVYDYPDGSGEATPFNAIIEEQGGSLSGQIIEPNTFSPEAVYELFASVRGWVKDREVTFMKVYEQAEMAGHMVRYDGIVNDAFDKIEGQWTTIEGIYSWSGPFVMNRSAAKTAPGEAVGEEMDMKV